MTPQHQILVDGVLQTVAQRTVELMTCLDYPLGRNPSLQVTVDQLRRGPLGTDLTTVIDFVEGYQIEVKTANEAIYRLYRILFGHTIQSGYRLPKNWQKTPFGLLVGQDYRKIIPQKDRMTTAETARALGIKRQTIYDMVEENKLMAFYIHERQTFHRPTIMRMVEQRGQQKTS